MRISNNSGQFNLQNRFRDSSCNTPFYEKCDKVTCVPQVGYITNLQLLFYGRVSALWPRVVIYTRSGCLRQDCPYKHDGNLAWKKIAVSSSCWANLGRGLYSSRFVGIFLKEIRACLPLIPASDEWVRLSIDDYFVLAQSQTFSLRYW